jgi:GxxExxY protein
VNLVDEELSGSVIGALFAVHGKLGFGFREHVYAAALEIELLKRGHTVAREFSAVVRYDGIEIARERLDMVVNEKLVLEIKSTERLHRDAKRQLYNYLRATDLEIGLLLHFGRSANVYRVAYPHHTPTQLVSPDKPQEQKNREKERKNGKTILGIRNDFGDETT